jgi:hypothetical protein
MLPITAAMGSHVTKAGERVVIAASLPLSETRLNGLAQQLYIKSANFENNITHIWRDAAG